MKFFTNFFMALLVTIATLSASTIFGSQNAHAEEVTPPESQHLSQQIARPDFSLGPEDHGRFIFVRSEAGLQRFVDCDWTISGSFSFSNGLSGPNCLNNDLTKDNPDAITLGSLTIGIQECYKPVCRVYIPAGIQETTYSIYEIGQSSYPCFENIGGNQDIESCLHSVGCIFDAQGGFACPPTYKLVSTVTAIKQAPPAPTQSPTPTSNFVDKSDNSLPVQKLATKSSFLAPSILATLQTWNNAVLNAQRIAFAGGIAIVLAILLMLPTQFINSTLEANSAQVTMVMSRIQSVFSRRRNTIQSAATNESKAPMSSSKRLFNFATAMPMFLLASVIASFAEPSFGLNGITARYFLTVLATFLLLNYGSVVLVWTLYQRKVENILPSIKIRYLNLLILTLTVLVSRILALEPVVVFGAVLVFETGKVIFQNSEVDSFFRTSSRMQSTSIVVLMTAGTVSWISYSLLVGGQHNTSDLANPFGEFLAALTIEALATLPIVLLPLRFMPGAVIFRWNRYVWFGLFIVSTTLFILMLMPLEQSWSAITTTLVSWVFVFLSYCALALLIWGGLFLYNKKLEARK